MTLKGIVSTKFLKKYTNYPTIKSMQIMIHFLHICSQVKLQKDNTVLQVTSLCILFHRIHGVGFYMFCYTEAVSSLLVEFPFHQDCPPLYTNPHGSSFYLRLFLTITFWLLQLCFPPYGYPCLYFYLLILLTSFSDCLYFSCLELYLYTSFV